MIYDVAKSLHEGHGVSKALYDEAVKLLSERGVVEIIGLCGYYTMVSMTLNTFEFGLPDGRSVRSCVTACVCRKAPMRFPQLTAIADRPDSPLRKSISRKRARRTCRHAAKPTHHRRHADRACPSQGRRSRSRARLLLRRARLRADAAHGLGRGVHFGRRLSPPHRPQHLGEQRRPSAAAGHHRAVPHRDPLSDAPGAGGCAASRDQAGIAARRRQRPRRQRGALSARSRRERRRAATDRPKNGRDAGRIAVDVHEAAGPRGLLRQREA